MNSNTPLQQAMQNATDNDIADAARFLGRGLGIRGAIDKTYGPAADQAAIETTATWLAEQTVPAPYVLAYPGCPLEWRVRPEDMPVPEEADQDTLVPGTGAEAIETLQIIAEVLGCTECTRDAIEDALTALQAEAAHKREPDYATPQLVGVMRTLWLVIREAGSPAGVAIDPRDHHTTDWSRARITKSEGVFGGNVVLRAEMAPEQRG